MKRLAILAIGTGLALAFLLGVWPTLFRPLALGRAPARILAARQHRITGAVDVLTSSGWHRLGPPAPPSAMPNPTGKATRDTTPDPLDGYRPDWRGYVPRDTLLKLNIAR